MNPQTLLSKFAPAVLRINSLCKASAALIVASAALMSFGQSAPVSITIIGPYSFKDTPAVSSYQVTVTNTSQATASSIILSNVLGNVDGAYLMAAQASQGSCDPGGQGITVLDCSLGALDPGASILVNVAAQMMGGDLSFSVSATGIDSNGASFSAGPVQRTTVHGNPPAGTPVISISLSANPTPKDLTGGRPGTLSWTLQNNTGLRANKLTFAMLIDNRMKISSSAVAGSNAGDPVSCGLPLAVDVSNNLVFCNIDYLGGSSSGSGTTATVTQLQVNVNYVAPVVSAQTTLLATGYVSSEGTDSSNPAATGQVRVK
jgi:Domain of unknown function DUF11